VTKQLEKPIEKAILNYLSFLPDCYCWKNNNTGIYDAAKKTYRLPKSKFHVNGVADIIGIYRGRPIYIEVKTKTGRVSKDQDRFLNRVSKLGAIAGVCRSVDDARELINDNTKTISDRLRGWYLQWIQKG